MDFGWSVVQGVGIGGVTGGAMGLGIGGAGEMMGKKTPPFFFCSP